MASRRKPSSVSRSNFFFGILFLPVEQRAAVKAIYAFCRVVDDAVDLTAGEGAGNIARWREELALCYSGAPRDPVMKTLYPYVKKLKLKREYFEQILQGMEMDLARRRYQSMEELEEYCHCVAGTVGLLCMQVFGLHEDSRALEYSKNLSMGLQLTNILRDIGTDALLDRVYLPQDDFATFDYTEKELKAGVVNMNYFNLARFTAGRARMHFSKADRALDGGLRGQLIGPEIMRETYQALLNKMTHALDLALDRKPPRLSWLDKFSTALGTWIVIKVLR